MGAALPPLVFVECDVYLHTSQIKVSNMHRTQIYLQDELYESLKARARTVGVSLSELIRRTLEKDIQNDPVANAQAFFDQLKPLSSFADVDSQDYVKALRSRSRLLRNPAKA
jgi:negative regulator of replication initiation